MAQAKKKRRRKHRGTQGGGIDRRSRPRNREQARSQARRQVTDRRDVRPTWRSAATRALIAAGIFFALLVLLFGQPLPQALALGVFMLAFYIPLGYGIDTMLYTRRQRAKQRAKQARQQQ
ncbi:MAG: hypothetical protein ABI726_04495 [bacterium]